MATMTENQGPALTEQQIAERVLDGSVRWYRESVTRTAQRLRDEAERLERDAMLSFETDATAAASFAVQGVMNLMPNLRLDTIVTAAGDVERGRAALAAAKEQQQ